MDITPEAQLQLVQLFRQWGFWALAIVVFMWRGMPYIAPIISAIGQIFNERHKTNLLHKRSMSKIENQNARPRTGKNQEKRP